MFRSASSIMLTLFGIWMASCPAVQAQPAGQPIHLIFPFVAGGTGDALARILAERMQSALGQPVIVENRAGATGQIGTMAVKTGAPDGATLLITPGGPMTLVPHYNPSLGYDTETDFAPVSHIVTFDFAIAVNSEVPAKNLKELADWLKAHPEKALYAHPGSGTSQHFFGILFGRTLGINFTPVSYRGSAAALNDVIGGQVPVLFSLTSDVIEQHRAGRIRVLATSDRERSRYFPDVPTFRESGFDVHGTGWYAIYAPAKTPAPVIARLNKVIVEAVHSPEIASKLEAMGFKPTGTSPAELADIQKAESAFWGPVVKASGFKPEQ
jgi:tripartite-type tricarboxylate transporter receptor subunit TctC